MNRREFTKACSLAAVAALTGSIPDFSFGQSNAPATAPAGPATPRTRPFILGADISWLLEDEASGATYWDRGVQKDMFDILKTYGINYIRARIFVNPQAPRGYASRREEAFCDLEHVKKLGTRVKAAGMGLLVSCHYSDTWASPDHQSKPAAWADLPFNKLVDTVHDWTANMMKELKVNQTVPDMVSIGNETTTGILFPDGQATNFDNFAALTNAGCLAVREFDKSIPVALHNHLGRDNAAIVKWVDGFLARKTEFDIIGMSCYSQKSPDNWEKNFTNISTRYPNLSFVAMEYSYQKRELNDLIFNAPNNKGLGSFIWEPTRWREAIFDHNGVNAGNDENNRPHLPATTLPPLSDPKQPTYHAAIPPIYPMVDGNAATNRTTAPNPASRPSFRATSRPTSRPFGGPTTRGGMRNRTGGRYDTNSYILAYPQMAAAYGLVAKAK